MAIFWRLRPLGEQQAKGVRFYLMQCGLGCCETLCWMEMIVIKQCTMSRGNSVRMSGKFPFYRRKRQYSVAFLVCWKGRKMLWKTVRQHVENFDLF